MSKTRPIKTGKGGLFVLLSLLLLPLLATAQSYTISGIVTDKSSGETLISAIVLDEGSGKGVATNAYGRYSLTLPAGEVKLRISYVGYTAYEETFTLSANRELNVTLDPTTMLEAVTVTAEKVGDVRSSQVGAVEVPVERIKNVPVIFGETDILKVVQLLPGVQSGTEGMAGIYVRGGGPDENLFLLDGVPLYNVNHLGGFFSAFNGDAVKNVTLYKGNFPARFGGRLSSVLDVTTNNGNDKELHGNVDVGLISAKINLEGPIIKERTTFSLSARRTYFDILSQPMIMALSASEGSGTMNAGYYFYDLNAKVTHRIDDKNHLFASFYMGSDKVYARLKYKERESADDYYREFIRMGYNWGNIVGSLRWYHQLSPKLFMNVTGAYTRYKNYINMGMEGEERYQGVNNTSSEMMTYKSGIQDLSAMADFHYMPAPNHDVKFGLSLTHHTFTPEVMSVKEEYTENNRVDYAMDTTVGQKPMQAGEFNAYIEDDWSLGDYVKINAGLHLAAFSVQDTFYPSVQPRLSARVLLTDDLSFKAGYSYVTQYMHLLSSSNISLPTDLWVPVTQRVAPMGAHQVAAGLFYRWHEVLDLSVEGYYKRMNNLLEYKDGASFFNSTAGWENKVVMGEGWAYGVEFLAQKNVGKWTGWVGYTWSKTMRLFDRPGMELNNGEAFPAKYDRRHDVSIVLMYKPNKRFDVSATWVYSTGNATTLALQSFEAPIPGRAYGHEYEIPYIEHRNNYRMPAYHRMDLGMNFHKEKKRGVRTWSISVYNLYNRKNPFLIYTEDRSYEYDRHGNQKDDALMQLSLFPIIPSFSYSFKF